MRQPEIVDYQAARLVPEDAIHPRDRLHQPVAAHRLVDIHGVQARRIESGQPHVAYEHDLKRISGVAEPVRERLAARLVADMGLPVGRVRSAAGHHNLDASLVILLVMPTRA